ncbi:MAG: ATP-grasp domain-containing protein, partial [Vallitaleaceae bacterium]|nr:ATP-grasp domain-containing protein [Vallitaleaceae bacterium]
FVKTNQGIDIVKIPFGLSKKPITTFDVALPITHGNKGEDGSLQGMFEMLDIPYGSSNVGAAAVSMDKVMTKYILTSLDIPVVAYVAFYKYEWLGKEKAWIERIEEKLAYPMIVKPASGGSSIGVTKAKNKSELIDAVDLAISMDERVLVERMVESIREINCSVLGDIEHAETSFLEEPVANSEILSFNDKYMGNQSKGMVSAKREIPAKITEAMQEKIEDYSLQVFKAFGCSGVVRIDYIIDASTEEVFFNEMNTIPGSLSFYLWEPKGKSYKELLTDIIKIAMQRFKRKADLSYSFNNNLFQVNNLDGLKK